VGGPVTEATGRFLARRPFGEGDPRGVSAVVAVRAAELVDADGSPGAARLLVAVVRYLAWSSPQIAHGTGIDEIRARRYARMLAGVLAGVDDVAHG
jgi:hypothetical protein